MQFGLRQIKLAILIIIFVGTSQWAISKNYVVTDHNILPDGATNNTSTLQQLIDKCSNEGGGELYFPSGTYMTGTLTLKSNITFYLENGAILKGIADFDAYPAIPYPGNIIRNHYFIRRSLLYAEGQENITITGDGTIDGNGGSEIFQTNMDNDSHRPLGIRMLRCKNIKIEGITLLNFASWTQHYFECLQVKLLNLNINSYANLNNDGIDIDACEDVIISGCRVDCEDDAICLKSQSEKITKNITISNCIVSTHCGAIKFGTGSYGGFKNIIIDNIVVKPSKAKKLHTGTGYWEGIVGIALEAADGGYIENVLISNIVLDSIRTPIFIKSGSRNTQLVNSNEENNKISYIKNVSLSNISAYHAGVLSSAIAGHPESYIEDINLNNINIHCKGEGTWRDTSLMVIENAKTFPSPNMFAVNLPSYAMYARHVKNMSMKNVRVTTSNIDARPAFVFDDVKNSKINDIDIPDSADAPQFIVSNCVDITFNNITKAGNLSYFRILQSDNILNNGKEMVNQLMQTRKLNNELTKKLPEPNLKLSFDKNEITQLAKKKIVKHTGIEVVKGTKSSAAKFNGEGYIQFSDTSFLNNISDELTICFWLKLDENGLVSNPFKKVVSKKEIWDEPVGFEVEINPTNQLILCSGSNIETFDKGLFEFQFDTSWHHYALVYQDSSVSLYVDGKFYGSDYHVSPPKPSKYPLSIGASPNLKNGLNGVIDELYIFKQPLKASEVKKLFENR